MPVLLAVFSHSESGSRETPELIQEYSIFFPDIFCYTWMLYRNFTIGVFMFKIGVLSDTHIQDPGQGISFLQDLLNGCFREVDMILHAGDIINPDVLAAFTGRTVHVVRGNMDPPVRGLPISKIIEAGTFRIGLIHGWGCPDRIEDRILREFHGERLDCIVYGHSHQPVCHRRDGILFFNPGSPTDCRRAPYHSVGILEVNDRIEGRIIPLE